MAISIPLKIKLYFRARSERKRKRLSGAWEAASSTCEGVSKKSTECTPSPAPAVTGEHASAVAEVEDIVAVPVVDIQPNSPFLQKLPIEIRRMIYGYVWQHDQEHHHHVPKGRHLHFKQGHWTNTRCVMFPQDDEDADLIQRNMDRICEGTLHGSLETWQRRLTSTWGRRHWRCEERVEYGTREYKVDHTDFGSLLKVCKRMYPEVMESILETNVFVLNDLFSAHRFLVHQASPFVSSIRHLDLTLHVASHECSPSTIEAPHNRVKAVLDALGRLPRLRSLRLAFDVYDRGPWRKVPEDQLMKQLRNIDVKGNFTVEFPPSLPAITKRPTIQKSSKEIPAETEALPAVSADPSHRLQPPSRERNLIVEDHSRVGDTLPKEAGMRVRTVRQPLLRCWQFHPGHEVEHFKWNSRNKVDDGYDHRWITISNKDVGLRHYVDPTSGG